MIRNLSKANEANPMGGFLMHTHVSGIFIISGLWLLLIGLLGFYLPKRVSRYFLVFVLVSHSIAASSWIFPRFGFWSFIGLALINSSLFVFIDERVRKFQCSE
ncbi:MAG: hypothetical protein JEZ03_18150 [Bacteroidales bacterium]|nr:hypothetical protein [Bacteroidales bacterium]